MKKCFSTVVTQFATDLFFQVTRVWTNCSIIVSPVTLDVLHAQEDTVLEYWTSRKRELDDCQKFVHFERSADETLEWIHDTGERYLSTHTNVGNNIDETRSLLEEHNEFKATAKVRFYNLWEDAYLMKSDTIFFSFFKLVLLEKKFKWSL